MPLANTSFQSASNRRHKRSILSGLARRLWRQSHEWLSPTTEQAFITDEIIGKLAFPRAGTRADWLLRQSERAGVSREICSPAAYRLNGDRGYLSALRHADYTLFPNRSVFDSPEEAIEAATPDYQKHIDDLAKAGLLDLS